MNRDKAIAILRRFKQEHGDEYALTALGLFGSVAREAATDSSDVDVAFQTDRPNLYRSARMRLELEQVMGCKVDIIRLRDRMNPRLKELIEREAMYA